MKKYLSVLFMVAALGVAGCGKKKVQPAAVKTVVVTPTSTCAQVPADDKKEDYAIVA